MKHWIISDLHFDHYNIIKYCNRPFSSVEEMNETLIHNINKTVAPSDVLYLLGDLTFNHKKFKFWLEEINCQNKIFIKGNHDPKNMDQYLPIKGLKSFHEYFELSLDKKRIVMCHYPIASWNGQHHGSYMFYGHVHGNFKMPNTNSLDVGVDSIGFTPIEIREAIRMVDDERNRSLD